VKDYSNLNVTMGSTLVARRCEMKQAAGETRASKIVTAANVTGSVGVTFEAHQFNGDVWSFKQSASYSTAGFDQVKQNISISNTILNLEGCGPATESNCPAAVDKTPDEFGQVAPLSNDYRSGWDVGSYGRRMETEACGQWAATGMAH
jgi:hypothetical protein